MQLEPIRIVADWMADHSTGYDVNTLLESVELDGGDPRPNPVEIWDSTRAGWVARKHLSKEGSQVTLPALAVLLGGELESEGTSQTAGVRDGSIPIAIAVIEDNQSDLGTASALYLLRAVRRSLYHLNLNDYTASHRTRGNICLQHWERSREGEAGAQWNDARVTAALITEWAVRDQVPMKPTS